MDKPWEIVSPVYRSLEHGAAKKYFERSAKNQLDSGVAQIGDVFIRLQEARHEADYDPKPLPYGRREVLNFCAQARSAVETIRALPSETKLIVAVGLIMKAR